MYFNSQVNVTGQIKTLKRIPQENTENSFTLIVVQASFNNLFFLLSLFFQSVLEGNVRFLFVNHFGQFQVGVSECSLQCYWKKSDKSPSDLNHYLSKTICSRIFLEVRGFFVGSEEHWSFIWCFPPLFTNVNDELRRSNKWGEVVCQYSTEIMLCVSIFHYAGRLQPAILVRPTTLY